MKAQKTDFSSKVKSFRGFLQEYYPLLCVLVGYLLVAITIGPYQNGDTAWEYDAVLGVLKTGLPVANGGYLMDQPPLGFYIQAFFFSIFGLSFSNGTFLVTLFGLGCITLVYFIGRLVYSKTTGFFASLLFAFSPWHLILSRAFLIDAQCLFFSIMSLFVALLSFKRDSFKLFALSGIIFAAAFTTKLYAVFMLVPLLALFFQHNRRDLKRVILWLVAFSVPIIAVSFLWYQLISGIGLSSVFLHTDLTSQNLNPTAPTPFFVTNFLVSYGLGWLFIDAVALSIIVLIWQKTKFSKFLFFETACLAVIVCIVAVNTILGAALDLKAPFLNAIKYDYQALPFFSLLAASLVTKSVSLLEFSLSKNVLKKILLVSVAFLGLTLVAATVLYNLNYAHLFSTWDYLIFRVDPSLNEGYSLFSPTPIKPSSPLMYIQFFGYALALSGILWVGRHRFAAMLKKFLR